MTDKKAPQLFFVNGLCKECPTYVFDFTKKTWKLTETKPQPGDRIVIDMKEKVVRTKPNGDQVYDQLRGQKPLWQGDFPEKLKVSDIRVLPFAEPFLDSLIDPDVIHIETRVVSSKLT